MSNEERMREEIIREARSQMAREAVEARWRALDKAGRAKAVAPANEARRKRAAEKREMRQKAKKRAEVIAGLLAVME